jgi:YidC/Oxa1 family membrane protein insertase
MIGAAWYDPFLNGLGEVLAFLYSLVPNYGVAIILLTLGIRLLLLPLGIKQVRSMHAMQALGPKVKALQQKYKGNRQKLSEEQMKLYKEHGVSPFGGCLPLLLQIPVLIALFAVLRFPSGLTRIPAESELHAAIEAQHTGFLGANLLCAPAQAGGGPVELPSGQVNPLDQPLDCGKGFPVRIPYYLLLGAMIATTFYQTWQMQRASPGGSTQQQLMGRIMPVFFGFIGFTFPAGLIVYWTTTNLVQIGQQHFMLPKKGQPAGEGKASTGDGARRSEKPSSRPAAAGKGEVRREQGGARPVKGGTPGSGRARDRDGTNGGGDREKRQGGGVGERHGGSRKKRRKR